MKKALEEPSPRRESLRAEPLSVARRFKFPRSARVTRRGDYLRVQRLGRRRSGALFVIVGVRSAPGTTPESGHDSGAGHAQGPSPAAPRIGITVSSKVGNAVVRNRLKRWVREWARHALDRFPAGEWVVIARAPAKDATHEQVEQELARLLGGLA